MNTVRVATAADAASILDIYRPYIVNTSVTFETEVPSAEAFSRRILSYLETWPWLVYDVDDVIAGYAYATRHRERIAYQWCVESSIYIHHNFMTRGIGTILYNTLFRFLEYQGFRNVYAVINLPNDDSVAFHEKLGFTWFANYKNVGYKLGKWKTVGWWVKQVNNYTTEPSAPIRFADLPPHVIDSVLSSIPGGI